MGNNLSFALEKRSKSIDSGVTTINQINKQLNFNTGNNPSTSTVNKFSFYGGGGGTTTGAIKSIEPSAATITNSSIKSITIDSR